MAASSPIDGGHAMRPILLISVPVIPRPRHPPDPARLGAGRRRSRRSRASRTDREPADPTIDELLAAHNKVRAEEKRPPLKLNAQLTEAARGHARDMAEHNKLSHEGSDGSDPEDADQAHGLPLPGDRRERRRRPGDPSARSMRTWIESPPHRENILGDFTEMGGAVAKGSDGRNYWCVDFGRPMPQVDPAKSPGEMIAALNRARAEAKKQPLRRIPSWRASPPDSPARPPNASRSTSKDARRQDPVRRPREARASGRAGSP